MQSNITFGFIDSKKRLTLSLSLSLAQSIINKPRNKTKLSQFTQNANERAEKALDANVCLLCGRRMARPAVKMSQITSTPSAASRGGQQQDPIPYFHCVLSGFSLHIEPVYPVR